MSIHEFYNRLGNISLNISLFFIVIGFISIIYFIFHNDIALLGAVFLLISVFYYFIHIYFVKKSSETAAHVYQMNSDSEKSHFLIEHVNNELYFFLPCGLAEYHFLFKRNSKGMFFSIKNTDNKIRKVNISLLKNGSIQFIEDDQWFKGKVERKGKKLKGEIKVGDDCVEVVKNSDSEVEFRKNHLKIAAVKKGWLPIKWTSLFRLNTPVLLVFEKISESERMSLLSVIAIIHLIK